MYSARQCALQYKVGISRLVWNPDPTHHAVSGDDGAGVRLPLAFHLDEDYDADDHDEYDDKDRDEDQSRPTSI